MLQIDGKNAKEIFETEAGGHRWQRIPPTEKKGRVHTSTITVAVLPEPQQHEVHIDPNDVEEEFMTGSGAGGQHRNKSSTAVRLHHKPTGLSVRSENNKSQKANREAAMAVLRARLFQEEQEKSKRQREQHRRKQVGSGQRGDKRRTIQVRNNIVTDHMSGKKIAYKDYAKGKIRNLK